MTSCAFSVFVKQKGIDTEKHIICVFSANIRRNQACLTANTLLSNWHVCALIGNVGPSINMIKLATTSYTFIYKFFLKKEYLLFSYLTCKAFDRESPAQF